MLRFTAMGARTLRQRSIANSFRSVSTQTKSVAAPARNFFLSAGMVAAGVVTSFAFVNEAQCAWYWPFGEDEKAKTPSEWDDIRVEIDNIISKHTAGPLFVRLAWHLSGSFDKYKKDGGSNGGTMRFQPEAGYGANAGLGLARDLLEQVKKNHPNVSYADLYTFAGAAAIVSMGGPDIPWKAGRTDADSGAACAPDGRLPDAKLGSDHIRTIFNRLGFNDREIVALLGAHTLGECHKDRSGFVGPWTRDPNGFDNSYYTLLLEEKWTLKPKSDPVQFQDKSGELMMLPSDMALLVDPAFRVWVDAYAKDSALFFKDFAAAFGKLLENGVPREKKTSAK